MPRLDSTWWIVIIPLFIYILVWVIGLAIYASTN